MKLSTSLALASMSFGLLVFAGFETSLAKPEPTSSGLLPTIIFVQAPRVELGELAGRFPKGSHLVRFLPGTPSQSATDLTPNFFAVADPQISFDATKVLFSGQKSRGSRWQIWEMKADGSGKRQLTNCPGDCFRPAYLPRNQVAFTMVSRKGSRQRSAIYVSKRDGSDAHPITFGPGDFQVETVLQSGRILVSAKSSLVAGDKDDNSRVFYTLRPDGSGLSPLPQGNRTNVIRTDAEELLDGTLLFVERSDTAGRETGGQLAWIRPGTLGVSVATPQNSNYWSAHTLDGNRLVVSEVGSGSSGMNGNFGLYVFNSATKSLGKVIYDNPKFSSVQAVPLEPRPVPKYYWSILHPTRDYGRIVCLNSYISADSPHGRLTTHIADVRVIALQPDHHQERILGVAPVESDGSFYIKVPSDLPIRFELLNAKGGVIHAQKSWIWARTGEDVPCLGCHESKALVPEDRWPLALRRSDTPIPVGIPSHSPSTRH